MTSPHQLRDPLVDGHMFNRRRCRLRRYKGD